jgi:carbamoyltransferase
MIILGISEQHEAHACLIVDGEIRCVIAEERLSRLKTDSGFPIRAINKIFEISKIEPKEIDCVAFASSS